MEFLHGSFYFIHQQVRIIIMILCEHEIEREFFFMLFHCIKIVHRFQLYYFVLFLLTITRLNKSQNDQDENWKKDFHIKLNLNLIRRVYFKLNLHVWFLVKNILF
jgi:hypothetical protein